ncbi:MAG: hypothetical protein F2842_09640 [Actinobacteria bacterium]|uniref:Unannotated protein n=1 Tax=freshwater metagenome TaxID=449393 RepID=A0A6J7KXT4_9ZZZZ|nr:hypothetical protein [Actinomycetota bacterium]
MTMMADAHAQGLSPEGIHVPVPTAAFPGSSFPIARLIPQSVADSKRVRRARRLAVVGIGGAVLAVGGLWMMGSSQVAEAEQQLADAQAASGLLAAQQAKFSDVPRVASELANARQDLELALGSEVLWSSVLAKLQATAPKGVSLTKITAALPEGVGQVPAAPANGTAGSTGSTSEVVIPAGRMTVAGTADSYSLVAGWLDALAADKLLLDPTLTHASTVSGEGTPGVGFDNTVDLAPAAKSGRYVTKETP